MSGRPQGPYTVKKRSPVVGIWNRLLYTWAISSFDFLLAAYRLSGWFTLWCTEYGMSVLAPYTLELLAYTRCSQPWLRQPSRMCAKPSTLLSI